MKGLSNLPTILDMWKMVDRMGKEPYPSKEDLMELLEMRSVPTFTMYIKKIRETGIRVQFHKSENHYRVDWPIKESSVKLNSEQSFLFFAIASELSEQAGGDWTRLKETIQTDLDTDIITRTPRGSVQLPTESPHFEIIKKAILRQQQVAILYESKSSGSGLRMVNPYHLVQTPMSWYMVGWAVQYKEFRNYKLARIKEVEIVKAFQPQPFSIEDHLGDAWWIRHNPGGPKHKIKVLFKGDEAQSIFEYRLHPTQHMEKTPDGTFVSWELSELSEFTTWLMQWLGSIEIIKPVELTHMIEKRVGLMVTSGKAFKEFHKATYLVED